MLSSTFSPRCTRISPYGVVSLSRSKEAKNQNLNEFDQHWVIWNDHCAFVTAVYHVFERPCVFVLISVKIRILYVFKQSTQANSEQDKNAVLHWNCFSPNINLCYVKCYYTYFVGHISFWLSSCSDTNVKRGKHL